jgi:hypothetical protein
MLVNTHLLYPLLLDTVMKKRIDNPDPENESGKSLLTWAQVLKAVATFAVPVLIIVLILKLAGC